ncbi:gamma-glutamylcyclotransferase family protein [Streptomyces sp. NPDC101181]|uniref:gamma-glutamylcyclotransferase family protein n=1 Tax=Streptomyces sp. NPDC101181 TaxID=3366125 RepID=UPI0037F21B15
MTAAVSTTAPGSPPAVERPFFVYGTLLPGEPNHELFLRGRTARERPAVLPRALLYEGPGHPYAIDGHGRVHGTLLTAAPGVYGELLGLLDHLEEFLGPGHPRNLYERVVRDVEPGPDGGAGGAGGSGTTVRAWVYLAAAAVTRSLRTGGVLIPGGRWTTGRTPGGPDSP